MDVTEDSLLPVRIHCVRPENYEAIAAVWAASGLGVRPQGRDCKEAFLRQLQAFPDSYLVALDGERIVGVIFGTHDGRKGWINRLAVLPAYRRRGIASALVRQCEEAIRNTGIGIVAALVDSENETSTALFRSLGYLDDVPVRYLRKLDRPEV